MDMNEPVLVLLDNHSSRGSIDQRLMWDQHQIAFYFLPPHTSHLIQPLDRTCNGVFKSFLHKDCHLELTDNTHEKRIKVLRCACSLTMSKIVSLMNIS